VDGGVELLAPLGREELGIRQALHAPARIEDDRCRHDRAGEWTAPDLVDTGHTRDAGPPGLGLVAVRRRRGRRQARTGALLGFGRGGGDDVDPLLAQARSLAGQRAEIVELAAPHPRVAHDVHAVDPRGGKRKGALHADAVRDAPDRERGARALTTLADDRAVEDLRTLFLALDDLHVHADLVPGLEAVSILFELRRLNDANRVHDSRPSLPARASPAPRRARIA